MSQKSPEITSINAVFESVAGQISYPREPLGWLQREPPKQEGTPGPPRHTKVSQSRINAIAGEVVLYNHPMSVEINAQARLDTRLDRDT